jgi:pyrimidine operon attenuation protein / uracil phosphoribosyltransferase
MSHAAVLSPLRAKGRILSSSEIERTLVRLAHQIIEKNGGGANLGLVGIRSRGVPLAERLAKLIEGIEKQPVLTGALDIQLYRDDRSGAEERPVLRGDEIGFEVAGRNVLLVDDVLYTGRTTRAALDALFAHGRPKRVQLAVLIDRGHRELPIEASFVGRVVPTTSREVIQVRLRETDGVEEVVIAEAADAEEGSR